MDNCTLPHIPERLHSIGKVAIQEFSLGEKLFRRCKHEHISDPFDSISLYDLSLNREGDSNDPISLSEDVLLCTEPSEENQTHHDESIVTLEIKELNEDQKTFLKKITSKGYDGNNNIIEIVCEMHLIHDILPCNYSHCELQIYFNGTKVDKGNYKTTIGKKSTSITELRSKCKFEINQMIISKELRITNFIA